MAGIEKLAGEGMRQAFQAAQVGYSLYGFGDSIRKGDTIGAVTAGLSLAATAYGVAEDQFGSSTSKVVSGQPGDGEQLTPAQEIGTQYASTTNIATDASPALTDRAGGGIFHAAGRVARDVIGIIWALPNTIIGLAVGLVGLPFGAKIQFGNKAIQFTNYPFGGEGEALTLGNVQIYPVGSDPTRSFGFYYGSRVLINLGLHEQAHTLQAQVFGPFFLPAYFLSGGIGASNPFELAANRYALGGSFLPY